jgi:hypothetical protein
MISHATAESPRKDSNNDTNNNLSSIQAARLYFSDQSGRKD